MIRLRRATDEQELVSRENFSSFALSIFIGGIFQSFTNECQSNHYLLDSIRLFSGVFY